MLNRSQIYTLLMMRKRGGNIFSALPRDLIGYIGGVYDNDDQIATLIHHIAYGNLTAAKAMLDANPRLVLQSAHTQTPSGLKVLHATPLECALGAGDPEIAEMIAPYFDQFDGGAKVRDDQFARYHLHVEDILNCKINPPYDFSLLIDTLIEAPQEDVVAALNLDLNHESALRDVLVKFRKYFTVGTIVRGMHFNYLNLIQVFVVYQRYFDEFIISCNDHAFKLQLFCKEIIDPIMSSLPTIDRWTFLHGLYSIVEKSKKVSRSFNATLYHRYYAVNKNEASFDCDLIRKLISSKIYRLVELMRSYREEKASRCVIL
jgi:hypothetical protein